MSTNLRVKMPSIKDSFEGTPLCINKHIGEVVCENINFKFLLTKTDYTELFGKNSDSLDYLKPLLKSIICDNKDLATELDDDIDTFEDYSDELIFKILNLSSKEVHKKILLSISDYYKDSISLKSESSKLLFEQYSSLVICDICYQVLVYMSENICKQYKSVKEFIDTFGTKCEDNVIDVFKRYNGTNDLSFMLAEVLLNEYSTAEFGLKIIEEFERYNKVGNN